ncbi:MAG: thioredoxin family protein, partial [Myxococcota bacterium]|nr:thioredoxin family protein [Myxococcota bacterium]
MRGRLLILPALLIACSGTRIPSSSVASTSEPTGTITGPPTRTTVGTPATSWAAGTPAAATTAILTPNEPVALRVPAAVAAQVTGPTLLFYFSPTCPHCESVMPEINQLRTQLPDLTFVGIPTGS